MAHDLTVRFPGARGSIERFTIDDIDLTVHATDTEHFACVEEAPAAA